MTVADPPPLLAAAWRWRPWGGAGVERRAGPLARAAAAGAERVRLLADVAWLAAGPGRVSPADYQRLRLGDERVWSGTDRRAVAGRASARRIVRSANFRRDWLGFAGDRMAWTSYLDAHGLPVQPVLAVYRQGLASPGALRTRDELRSALEDWRGGPLILRPSHGRGRLLFAGDEADWSGEVDRAIDDVGDRSGETWLLQRPTTPHRGATRDAAGRPSPVWLLTFAGERGARVARAWWRLGGRRDAGAALDLKTGEATGLFLAAAPEKRSAVPAGFAVPDWPRLKAAAVEGARLLSAFGLLAWKIAPGADGPVIEGLDAEPDLDLFQLADRRGLVDAELGVFLTERRRARRLARC
jgi:hypothetical protein